MGLKFLATVLCASLSLTSHISLAQSSTPTSLLAQVPEATNTIASQDDERSQQLAEWLIALGLLAGAIAISVGVYRYSRSERWNRIEFLRKTVKEFENDPDIWNALKILDSEEYREYEFIHQREKITFKVNHDYLIEALTDRKNRIRKRREIEILQNVVGNEDTTLDETELEAKRKELAALERQFAIETELRNWFNKMLNGLEHFGYFIESGMFSANEIRPWMNYWIRLIADRDYKRKGASKFYDQLYSYIHASCFPGVIKLFESFGYRILPTPYDDSDFSALKIVPEQEMSDLEMLQSALSLAKAAYLVYQDETYVKEISYERWHIERGSFSYFEDKNRDTQVCVFKTKFFIVVAFRGSQETKDWQTNFSTRLRKITVKATTMEPLNEDWTPPIGQVHRGFQSAWEGVEGKVIGQIKQWSQEQSASLPVLITGHSLGGALATVAAASLVKRRFNVQGLYTFGQPRVGDLVFVGEIGGLLKGKVFRFVNNNDVVPHVPPHYLPWNPTRLYIHMGSRLYFDARGNFTRTPNLILRLIDFGFGLLRASFEPGIDLVNDHRMEFYISNLEKALKLEREKQKLEGDVEDAA